MCASTAPSSPNFTIVATASSHQPISAAQALEIACAAYGGSAAAEPELVERLDGGQPYYLVGLHESAGRFQLVAVNAISGAIMASAATAHSWSLLSREQAIAQLSDTQTPADRQPKPSPPANHSSREFSIRLVWKPSRASLSPLYPLWQVSDSSGRSVYVDHTGHIWPQLLPASPGS